MPSPFSMRIIFILVYFGVLFFYQAYCGYLVSSLTITIPHYPFTNLEGFFESGEYKIMTLAEGFHKYYFKKVIGEGIDPSFMLQEGLPKNVQEAVDKLCEDESLVFTEFREELLDLDKFKCKILNLPRPIVYIFMMVILPRNSPYTDIFRREKIYLESTGIMQKMRMRLSSLDDFLDKDSKDEFVPVKLSQVFTIFILLGIGICVSVFILSLEYILSKMKFFWIKRQRIRTEVPNIIKFKKFLIKIIRPKQQFPKFLGSKHPYYVDSRAHKRINISRARKKSL